MHLTCLDSLSFYPLPVFVCATSEGPACGTGYVKCDRTHRRHAVEFNFICSALIDCASGRKYVRTSTSAEYYVLIASLFPTDPTIRSSARWEPLLPNVLRKRTLRHRRSSRIIVAQRWKIRCLIGTGSLRPAVAINLHPIEFAIYLRARSVVADRCAAADSPFNKSRLAKMSATRRAGRLPL